MENGAFEALDYFSDEFELGIDYASTGYWIRNKWHWHCCNLAINHFRRARRMAEEILEKYTDEAVSYRIEDLKKVAAGYIVSALITRGEKTWTGWEREEVMALSGGKLSLRNRNYRELMRAVENYEAATSFWNE
ncbi:MAG: hypothetical protein HY513_00125 [Candidatus Aenigmarchaeota archaeon]|nr:hypothetical protein [Candidatus Aenigmarchaeota archaeon]